MFYSVFSLLIIPVIENDAILNPCTSLLYSFCAIFRLFAPRHCVSSIQLQDATHHTNHTMKKENIISALEITVPIVGFLSVTVGFACLNPVLFFGGIAVCLGGLAILSLD